MLVLICILEKAHPLPHLEEETWKKKAWPPVLFIIWHICKKTKKAQHTPHASQRPEKGVQPNEGCQHVRQSRPSLWSILCIAISIKPASNVRRSKVDGSLSYMGGDPTSVRADSASGCLNQYSGRDEHCRWLGATTDSPSWLHVWISKHPQNSYTASL